MSATESFSRDVVLSDGSVLSANFHDDLDRTGASHRLRAALSMQGDWLPAVIAQAHERLLAIRATHRNAGALAIAMDQEHARDIARLIRNRYHVEADVVVSDDPDASNKIAEFSKNDKPWLVAVRMVSEGVDIPRLRVGVYASTVVTELFFRQAVGRFVRWTHGLPSQKAYVFLPDDPRLRQHAFQIAEARRHVLKPPTERDDEFTPEQLEREAKRELDLMPEQLSLFSVLSSYATGMSVHAFTEQGSMAQLSVHDEPVATDMPDPQAARGEAQAAARLLTFARETEEGTFDALLLSPVSATVIYLGKATANVLAMLAIEVAQLLLASILFDARLITPELLMIVLLGTVGTVALTTLLSTMAASMRGRAMLLPAMALPLLVPLLNAAAELAAGGYADPHDVDKVWCTATGAPLPTRRFSLCFRP